MIYKPPVEARVQQLEDENVGTTNELYELQIEIDMLKERLKTLENLIIGDGK
jgi:polyhydroxyalkanoate synthesis regulator phasin